MADTKIEWTDKTWNPIVGCSKVSAGCANCYAERMANRLACMGQMSYNKVVLQGRPEWTGKTAFVESALEQPLHWKKPQLVFVCSMGDLFHESVPFEWIDKVFAVMALCRQHTFQVLTKRPERMKEYICEMSENGKWDACSVDPETLDWSMTQSGTHEFANYIRRPFPLPNVWIGVTAENQEQADKRIPILLQIPAAKRFVSVEPMLSAVDLTGWVHRTPGYNKQDEVYKCTKCGFTGTGQCFTKGPDISSEYTSQCPSCFIDVDADNALIEIGNLDWIICGGETGPNARPMNPDWARDLQDQCKEANVPFFFKKLNSKGDIPEDLNIRQFPGKAGE